jgi:ribosomal protein L12E/L44/L45/RPP1/RPP2
MVSGAFKIFLALGVASGYEFKQLKEAQNASANAAANAGPADADAGDDAADEPSEESEDVSLGGMFSSD